MSGISTSGNVTLAGDNVFTGTNSFNINRPTSTLTDTPSSTDFITKQNGDVLYAGAGSGDVTKAGNNVFTGTNSFNNNRPTSTLTTTPISVEFITKQNGEALFAPVSVTGDVTLSGTNAFTGSNSFNTNRPTSTLTTTPSSTDLITKQNADALYAPVSVTGDVTLAGTNAFTGTNSFNTNRPTSSITTTPSSTDLITKQNADALYAPVGSGGDVTLAGTNAFTGTNTFNSNLPTSTITPTSDNQLTRKGYVDDRLDDKLNNGGSSITINEDGDINDIDSLSGNGTLGIFNSDATDKGGIFIDGNGNVGINTFQTSSATLKCALVVDGANTDRLSTASNTIRFIKYNANSNNVGGGFAEAVTGLGLLVNGRICATDAIVSQGGNFVPCDERIKENIRDINEATEKLKLVIPRQYEFIDKVARGNKTEYGFIAQELEQHYPTFVNKDTYKIPNIMKTYDVSGTTIYDISNVNINDELHIIDKNGNDNIVSVIDVSSSNITIDKSLEHDECFIYGKDVDDFRVVNKEPIFTLTTASVIELIKRVETLEAQIKTLL